MGNFQEISYLVIAINGKKEADKIIKELIINENVLEIISGKNDIIKSTSPSLTKIYIEHISLRSEKISNLLIDIGFKPIHNGFLYLLTAIESTLSMGNEQFCITKDIYPSLAKRYRTAPNCIERCI